MYSRKILIAATLSFAIFFTQCSVSGVRNNRKNAGVWQSAAITIDGKNNDWPSPYSHYDDKAMLGYMVTNDSANLYITVETGDAATQLKIIKEGLTVWIDKSGKEQCITAINYPIPENAGKKGQDKTSRYVDDHSDMFKQGDIQKRMLDIRTHVKDGIANATEYSLQGFKGCNMQFPLNATNSCGIEVRMSMDQDNELIWEARIPFSAFFFKPVVSRMDRNRQISVCLETVAAKRPQNQPGNNNTRRGNGGGFRPGFSIGTGMGVGLGMQRGGYGNYNSPDPNANMLEPMYKSTKTWIHTSIAAM